jgi:hypothetical protein
VHYKGLLQEYVMLCYGFLTHDPACSAEVFLTQNVTQTGHIDRSHPHSTEHDTQPISYLISKQVVPY